MDRRHALAAATLATAGLAVLSTPVPPTTAAFNDVVTFEVGVTGWRPAPRDPPTAERLTVAPAEQAPPTAPDPGAAPEGPAPEPAPDATPVDEGSSPDAPPVGEPTAVPEDDTTAGPVEEAPSTPGPEGDESDDAEPADPTPTPDG